MELEILQNYFYFSGIFDDLKDDMRDRISQCDASIEVNGIEYVPMSDIVKLIDGDHCEQDTAIATSK